ncbi:hypothetical protein [Streptomyces sp. NBC_01803]|uniref:hypothetical protein n=1 Tax=Streptomyces sp. NBC_01803 TaxID=2975946 RepID=UPI002DDA1BF6|nr:hypothetical protein [Streptomyces sp. NBC_01803]WSA44980.1 hypothetical protein OIE51_12620 [Streptomyces sp. NBC_01803]
MAAPNGATSVIYTIHLSEGNPDLEQDYTFPVGTGSVGGDLRDDLAQTAANAMVALLQQRYPSRTVYASRRYQGAIDGTPWPTPEEA